MPNKSIRLMLVRSEPLMGLFLPLSVMEDWPDPGTPIRLVVKTWAGLDEHVGVALPSAGPGLVTIKLVNGYNLSFPSSYVEQFQVMGEMPEPLEVAT